MMHTLMTPPPLAPVYRRRLRLAVLLAVLLHAGLLALPGVWEQVSAPVITEVQLVSLPAPATAASPRSATRAPVRPARHGPAAAAAADAALQPSETALADPAPVSPSPELPLAAPAGGADTAPPGAGSDAPATAMPVAPPASTAAPAAASHNGGSDYVPADYKASWLNNSKPDYPAHEMQLGITGTTWLRLRVGRDGLPLRDTVTLHQSSGSPALDRAARKAVKNWRFVPARRGGEAVEDWVLVPVEFRLQG